MRATDTGVATVSVLYVSSGFGRDVASGAVSAAGKLNFEVQAVSFEPNHAVEIASSLPTVDVLLVVGSFVDELAAASVVLTRTWRVAAFVGAGVEEVLAPLGNLREGLLGPVQWIATAALESDEGPDQQWCSSRHQALLRRVPPNNGLE